MANESGRASGGNDANADIRNLLDLGLQACSAYNRPDLGERLTRLRAQIGNPGVQIVVVGEFKQGKSSLINALVNAGVCPVDDDIATAVPTVISYGETTRAKATVVSREEPDATPHVIPIELDQVPSYASELGTTDPNIIVKGVEVQLPRKLLARGMSLVDTPGVGGLGSAHATAALGALSVANAAVFVSDSSQEFTRTEIDFLAQAADLCPQVVCLQTKIDFYPAWRKVLEINKGHLHNAGYDLKIIPVSSLLRTEAVRRNDKELNAESGFADLVRTLSNDIVGRADLLLRNRACEDLVGVCDQLATQFDAELSALNDPEKAEELVRRLQETKTRSEQLRSQAAKWSTTLSDGVSDLGSDVDFDFRQRMRRITQEADKAIDNSDPADTWGEFQPWLVNRVSYEVVANHKVVVDRSTSLSREVAEHFELAGGELLEDLDVASPTQALSRVGVEPQADMHRPGLGAQSLTVVRGSYSGFLMFSVLGGMVLASMAIAVTPIGMGVGLLMGRKGLKDEKERQLNQRRSQAKNATRKYCDEVSFQVSKDSKDTLRRVQRQLRDHYSTRAEELNRSTQEALKAASEAAKVGTAERANRQKDLGAELGRIRSLRKQVADVRASNGPPLAVH